MDSLPPRLGEDLECLSEFRVVTLRLGGSTAWARGLLLPPITTGFCLGLCCSGCLWPGSRAASKATEVCCAIRGLASFKLPLAVIRGSAGSELSTDVPSELSERALPMDTPSCQ